MNKRVKQNGAAIVLALFVLSLVAAAAVAMIEQMRINVRRTELILNDNNANLYAQGAVAWAIDQLIQNAKQQPLNANKRVDKTPIQTSVDEKNGAKIQSVIYDAQVNFNINNITDSQYQTSFIKLIQIVYPKISQAAAKNIMLGVLDWLSKSSLPSFFDQEYAKLKPAYKSAHQLMASISELRLVKGVTPALFMALSPYLIALPEVTKININGISIPVLMSLSDNNMTVETAKAIIEYSKQKPFDSMDQFRALDIIKNNPIPDGKLTIVSQYFLLKTNILIGEQHLIFYTLLQRVEKNKQPQVNVLWQSKGTL